MKRLGLHYFLLALVAISFAACKDDPPVTPPQDTGTFELAFDVNWGANDLLLSDPYTAPNGRKYQIDVLKFFVGRVTLYTPSDSAVVVDDVALVDLYRANSNIISAKVPVGSYNRLTFNIGLDAAQNQSDPSSFPTNHPMSTVTNMYWTWATRYVFTMVEGRADTTGGFSDRIFLYHCGADSLIRPVEVPSLNLALSKDETKRHTISIDMEKLFFGVTNPVDIDVDPNTHTTDNMPLAERVMDLFIGAMQ